MLSVIILTKNEENDLPSCLDSLLWCDDLHVVDSGSTDKTVEIAHNKGAKTYVNPFQSFAQQRNWSLVNCLLLYEWVLFLDADEHSTDAFQDCIQHNLLKATSDIAGFYCCGKTILGNRWLKKSDNFPKWQYRLMRKERSNFIDVGHGQKEGVIIGRIEYIKEPYLHFAFSHGFDAWKLKHLGYAVRDAEAMYAIQFSITDLLSRHGSKRNAAIKVLLRRLPGWPLLRFIFSYILQGGFTEGKEALIYCGKILWYERQVKKQFLLLVNQNR